MDAFEAGSKLDPNNAEFKDGIQKTNSKIYAHGSETKEE